MLSLLIFSKPETPSLCNTSVWILFFDWVLELLTRLAEIPVMMNGGDNCGKFVKFEPI